MNTCVYQPVSIPINNENGRKGRKEEISWIPFLRQLLICSCLWTTYFVTGLCLGSPTVVIPQERKAHSADSISDEMASWLSSALSYSTLPSVLTLPIVTRYFGRKPPFMFAITTSIISLVIFYNATTMTQFLISQIIQGILFGSNLTISMIMVTEYTSPRFRGMFLCIKAASLFWGTWASNAIGTFYQWNYIALFGLVCSGYYITVFYWPESPYWLATKGRFEECAKAHRWLKGEDEDSEKELENLIKSQREFLQSCSKRESLRDKMMSVIKTVALKEFYKPIVVSILVFAQYHSSGKLVCGMYSIELIKKITKSESTAYAGMLILDGLSVFGMYCGCFLVKIIKRRTLLFITSIVGIIFLFLLSLYLWLVNMSLIVENNIISVLLLSTFSVTISCGPMILSTAIYGELLPLRFKSSGVIIIIVTHFVLMGTGFKIAPFIFKTFSLHGTFAFYGIMATIFTWILYKYLPETKDKTLQEIENYFKDKQPTEINSKLMPIETQKAHLLT